MADVMTPPTLPPRELPQPAAGTGMDWGGKLRHLAVTFAFCLVIALVYVTFLPQHAYWHALTYSMAIGLSSCLLIDFGRHAFADSGETGWPRGWRMVVLVGGGLALGFLAGNFIGDQVAHQLGWGQSALSDPDAQLRNSLLVSLIAGLIVSYFFYSQGRRDYLERKMGEAQRHASEARLKLLESQLEPHMLFNTLANLRVLIEVDPPRAQQMLDHMIAYLRATLDASRTTTHPLQAEFDRLRDYLELMAIRMGPRLAYQLELPAELAALQVPTLLLQPLVENSIQHGLEPKVEGGRIDLAVRRDGDRLVLEVSDTGVGQRDGPRSGKGFGLAQVRERLASLYGEAGRMEFHSAPGAGSRTRISLPLPA